MFDFLSQLRDNNNREWFHRHKDAYETAKARAEQLFRDVYTKIAEQDDVLPPKMFRIYRDVRFSKNKEPYKTCLSAAFMRRQPYNRGSFYIHIEPGASFIGAGFWGPVPADVQRIRQALVYEDTLPGILAHKDIVKHFGALQGEELKTAPKGFDKTHPRIGLIRKKQFYLTHPYTDQEVLSAGFSKDVAGKYKMLLPFFHYMTDVLITDGNGEYIV
ncbi:MAG: hypothetical protein BGO09_01535 [Bacteroidetes bacterium 47-18]|nr:MAG: hypothetical protein BGO09_01535 [Bacteroidetes bacterium 47-18]